MEVRPVFIPSIRRLTRRLQIRPHARIWLLTTALYATAAILFPAVKKLAPVEAPIRLHWLALTATFVISEILVVHVQFKREAHSFSLSEVALVLGLLFATPVGLLVASPAGSAIALALHRRQSLHKLAFNVAHITVRTSLLVLGFNLIVGGHDPSGPAGWVAALVAMEVATLASDSCLFLAISLAEERFEFRRWVEMMRFSLLGTLMTSALALVGIQAMWHEPAAFLLLVVPGIVLLGAYRSYSRARDQHENLRFLFDASSLLHSGRALEESLTALLRETCTTLRAERAELTLLPPRSGDPLLRTTVTGDTETVLEPVPLEYPETILVELLDRGEMMLSRANVEEGALATYVAARQLKDAVAAPLRGEGRTFGILMLADRMGDVSTFDEDDGDLLETLTNQVAVALENGRLEQSLGELMELKEQLRHMAFHDALTGLANRALFTQRVQQAIDTSRAAMAAAPTVLFIDLDGFKGVNDTLGHTAGDRLLCIISERLQAAIRSVDTVARLGGDEFAVLVGAVGDPDLVIDLADRILETAATPIHLGENLVTLNLSVGIASAGPDVVDASDLIRNADVAMYRAKSAGGHRLEIFEPEMRVALVESHQRRSALLLALERDEFVVHFQPIVDLRTGRIAGTEALVRWQHPEQGLVPPGVFIPIAEETGLIVPIGDLVLRRACEQTAAWMAADPGLADLFVSVNLSGRQLEENDFAKTVEEVLEDVGLPPSGLVLEITEAVLIQHQEPAVEKLWALRQLGVQLAIDDFGTGYSSLAYLRRFPIDMLKVAREFVDGLGTSTNDGVLARAIVELASTLRLRTVAEGIEETAEHGWLRELRCQLGQGYLFAKPMPATQITDLLTANRVIAPSETAA